MLIRESMVVVTDNTGAKKAKIIGIPWGTGKKKATVGDYVVVAIKEASPSWSVKKWQVVRWLIVRTRKEVGRKDGTYVRFGDNAIVIVDVDAKGELKPKGKRIFWPIVKEIRNLWYKAVSNMAEEVI